MALTQIGVLFKTLQKTGWQSDLCTQQRLRSAWVSAQNDQESSLCSLQIAKDLKPLLVDSDGSDQTGQIPRLIWVFAGRTGHFVGFIVSGSLNNFYISDLCCRHSVFSWRTKTFQKQKRGLKFNLWTPHLTITSRVPPTSVVRASTSLRASPWWLWERVTTRTVYYSSQRVGYHLSQMILLYHQLPRGL